MSKSDYAVEDQKSSDTVSGGIMNEVSESNLFGPWMIVVDKRCKGGLTRAGITTTNNAISGSQFAALAIKESDPIHVSAQDNRVNESAGNPVRGKQVIRNISQERMVNTSAAYKSSNPDKKKKSSKSMPPVLVVPGGNGETVQCCKLILGSRQREPSRQSLQVRRGSGARVVDHVSASEFVNRVTSELHSFRRRDKASSSGGPAAHGALSPMLQSSDGEDFYRSNSPEILPEGAFFSKDQ
ncbi:hypothetical protein V6N11_021532 [Hibiscus sabdariffa]|uniref:Uncharacterized protein n=2 Tax=Hibiscus sabdariffa TaxID=183260 RepID=A0ABR2NHM8_9ROSI